MLLFSFALQMPTKANPRTIIVPDDYSSIQQAINAATPGDTIFVRSGTYHESLTINKPFIRIIGDGSDKTVISIDQNTHVIHIKADNVLIKGFKIINTLGSLQPIGKGWPSGIYIDESKNCIISKNNITHNAYNVWVDNSVNNTIVENFISWSLSGILLQSSSKNYIIKNKITYRNSPGIYLTPSSSNNFIAENYIANNPRGILIDYSTNNKLRENVLVNNTYNIFLGVLGAPLKEISDLINDIDSSNTINGRSIYYLINEKDITIKNAGYVVLINCTNVIVKDSCLVNNDMGVLLFCVKNATITQNVITNDWVGIVSLNSSKIKILENDITTNHFGVMLYGSSSEIYHNNFVNNTMTQAESCESVNIWDDGYPSGGNYWSNHEFIDEYSGPNQDQPGSDGICDKPYVIDENNIDHYPLMKPYHYKPSVGGLISSDYLKNSYKLANFTLVKDWVWKNCIPLLLINSRSTQIIAPGGIAKMYDADTNLQDENHRPDWYWRIVVDPDNKRFCVQLIGYWLHQWRGIEQCALLAEHPYDYEPIFLYYSYTGDDFFSSLEEGKVQYQYVFCPVGHGMVNFGTSKGTDCDVSEDEKLYFWTDEEGNKHPLFSLGNSFYESPLISSRLWTSFVGHAYGYVKRKGLLATGEDLVNFPTKFQFEGFWPDNKDYSNFQKHIQYLNDSIINEWSSRLENPFKMIPLFSDKSGPSYDLVDPWNSLYKEKYPSVGDAFNPNSLLYLGINYTVSSAPEEGEWSEEFNYTSVKADEITFYLNWEGETDLDLHIWLAQEEDGRPAKISSTHVGKNYETHEIENGLDGYKAINYLKVDYSGNTKPEKITITAYNYLAEHKIKAKIPSDLSFIIQVYTRKGGEDPSFMLVSSSYDESTIEKVTSSAEVNSYEFYVPWEGKNYRVTILSNATISNFEFNRFEKEISFNATKGFFNVSIPTELLDGFFSVTLNNTTIDFDEVSNETHSFLHFECNAGFVKIKGTTVIPEFSLIALPLLMILVTVISAVLKKFKKNS